MKKHTLPLFTMILLSGMVVIRGRQQYSSGEIQYAVRIANISDCSESDDKPLLTDVKWTTSDYTQYVSMVATIEKSIIVNKIRILIERCRDYQYACEDFQTWNITSFCSLILMQNQMWTPVINSITPKIWQKTCPRIDKGILHVTNATVDMGAFLRFYPDATKYHWRGKSYSYNKKNQLLYCIMAQGNVITYRKRQRITRSILPIDLKN